MMPVYQREGFLSYFPMFFNIAEKKILLVGAGEVAAFKYEKICEYHPKLLKVIAKEFHSKVLSNQKDFCELVHRSFEMSDLEGMDIVIVGVNDLLLQQSIYDECQLRKIPCNCVDELDRCDFIFSSTIKRGNIIIAISSSGKVPGFSVGLKDFIESILPDDLEKKMDDLRALRKSLPSGKERMARIKEEARLYFTKFIKGDK
jgi:precorrin-2 dehydrogenase/sirohydrochlorin ferrochelatase